MVVNRFRKSFSIKPACLAATENRISGKYFQFDRNFAHLTRKSFYRFILPSNHFLPCAKERESQRKKELNKPKERASERKKEPRTKRRSSEQTKRRSSHEPNADLVREPTADPATNQTPNSSHSGHAELTSPPILHGGPITEL